MGFANKKLGMGRDGFCQGISSISNMLTQLSKPVKVSLVDGTNLSAILEHYIHV